MKLNRLNRSVVITVIVIIFVITIHFFSGNTNKSDKHAESRGYENNLAKESTIIKKLILDIKSSIGLHKWCRNHQLNNMTYGQYVDKHWVKQYIQKVAPDIKISKEYAYVSSDEEITESLLEKLPQNYVVKPSHYCGEVIIVMNGSPETHMVRGPTKICKKASLLTCLKESCKFWLERSYNDLFGENYYKSTTRKCLFEEYLDTKGIRPIDIKSFTFYGRPFIIDVREHIENTEPVMQDYFTPSWTRLNLTRVPDQEKAPRNYARKKPDFLEKFLYFSEKIGRPFPFMRIDFFWYSGNLSFAEFSPTPHGCAGRFAPLMLERFYGFLVSYPQLQLHPDFALRFT